LLHVARGMHVENHQIADDPLEPPVVMAAEQLPDTRHSNRALYCGEKYRPVTGNAERPQCLLPESVFLDSALRRPESGMRKHQVASKILIQCRVSRRDPEIAQFCLCLRPRQIERATGAVGIVIKISELYRTLFVFGDESRESDMRGTTGRDPHSHP